MVEHVSEVTVSADHGTTRQARATERAAIADDQRTRLRSAIFVYRVKTDGNGPRAEIHLSEGKIP